MTIARNVSIEELTEWLNDKGFGESERGYGHAASEDIAEGLLERFIIIDKETLT